MRNRDFYRNVVNILNHVNKQIAQKESREFVLKIIENIGI